MFDDARIFQNLEINKLFKEDIIPACEKVFVPSYNVDPIPIPICILGDPTYPLLPYVMKGFPGGGKYDRKRFFTYRLSSVRCIVIENSFGKLKGRFGCLQRATNIASIYLVLSLRNYCELKK